MDLDRLTERVARLDAAIRPIAKRPAPIGDPGWVERMRSAPPAAEQAGVAEEAELTLRALIQVYADGDDATRTAVRELLDRYTSFRWAAHLPDRPDTAAGFRTQPLHLSARDHGADTRDELLALRDLIDRATAAGVDVGPVLAEVAALSSDVDRYGMGSIRTILLRSTARRRGPGPGQRGKRDI